MIRVQTPDGNIVEFPEDTPVETIKAVMSKKYGAPQKAPSKEWMEQLARRDYLQQAPFTAKAQKFIEGIPFIGSYFDELAGTVSPELGQKAQALSEAMEIEKPVESTALKLGGALATTAPAAAITGPVGLLTAPTRMGAMAKGAAVGGIAGATEGGIYGYGEGEGEERIESAKTGATFGGLAGKFLGGAAPVASEGVKNLVNYVKRSDLRVIQETLQISSAAAKVIKDVIGRGGNIDDAIANMQRAGSQGMIADANEAIQVLLDASAAASPKAAQIVSEAVDTRASQAGGRVSDVMDEALGAAPTGRVTASEEVARRTAKERTEAYKAAYDSPIDYSSPQGLAIEQILSRIPDDLVEKAIKEANDRMKFQGLGHEQIMATIADDGSVTLSKMPNMVQLDNLKKALGGMAEDSKGALGQETSSSLFYGEIAKDLRDALVNAVPSYERALQLGGDKLREQAAGELGYKLLRPSTTREQVARTLAQSTKVERQAARLGVRNYIDDTLANVKATISSPDVDVKAATRLLSDLSSKANQEKIGFILGPKQANILARQLDEVRSALELKGALAINSKTAQRQSVQQMVGDLTETGVLRSVLEGHPAQAVQKVTQAITGATKELQASERAQLFEELARVLTEKRGTEAQLALRTVMRAMDGQELNDVQANFIANVAIMGTAAPVSVTAGRALSE